MNVHLRSCIWLILVCTALSCNTTPDASTLFTGENLVTQLFTINTQSDTTIATAEGIQITIPANAILAPKTSVTLVIKEALSLSDIIQAGLNTQTKDDILSSSGMFYINTKEISFIVKPLQIKVPVAYADPAMRLFKGVTYDKRIKWDAPKPLITHQDEATQKGEKLFNQYCTSCHNTQKKLIGPALANVENRWEDRELLFKWIRNSASVLAGGDKYANCLYCEYNRMFCPPFPIFTDDEIEGILAFIDRETIRSGHKEAKMSHDSILYYQRYYEELMNKRDSLVNNNGAAVKVDMQPAADRGFPPDTGGIPVKVAVPRPKAEFYETTVTTYGWYNVDLLLKETTGAVKSELAVRLTGNYRKTINMYLVIPAFKVFAEGGLLNNGEYGFYNADGSIYLPQGKEAFIIAIGEEKGDIYYGQQQFVTALSQNIELSVVATSEEKMKASIKNLQLENVAITVKKAPHADDIKEIDREMERIRKFANICGCKEDPMQTDTSRISIIQ